MWGKTDEEKALVLQWFSLVNSDWIPPVAAAFKGLAGIVPYNKKAVTDAQAKSEIIVDLFEKRLSEYTYLVGERVTIADLFAVTIASKGFEYLWGTEWMKAHPALTRWFKTVSQHEIFAGFYKNQPYRETPLEYVPPKKEKKESQPKQAAKPKAAAAEEEKPAEEKKPKHPLELLGKSTKFVLDEWKRTYSNEDTRPTALPWFWEHYDPSEWSLWKVAYKYNDELTLTFMSNNLLGGFFNRLSASTKYMFGAGVVYGENNNNGIIGAFLIRGQDFKPAFDVAPDWESYEFTKLDVSKPEDKAFVEDAWAWDKPMVINGESREIADGKVLK